MFITTDDSRSPKERRREVRDRDRDRERDRDNRGNHDRINSVVSHNFNLSNIVSRVIARVVDTY